MINKSLLFILFFILTCLLLNGCTEEDYFVLRGVRDFEHGDYDSAINNYNKALKINPRNEKTYFNRGIAWFQKGNLDDAINDFTKSLEINRNFSEAYSTRGLVRQKQGNNDLAISDYTMALQLNPENSLKAWIFFNRAYAEFKRGNYESAINDYTKCIEIDHKKHEPYFYRAEARYEKGNLDAAISDYTKAIQINPSYGQAIFHRANRLHEKMEYASAIIDYEKAIEVNPKNPLVYSNYSWLLSTCPDSMFRNGTKALKLAQKALELRPDEGLFLDTLAAAYAELGNFEKAVQAEEKAIASLKKDNKNLKEILSTQLESYKAGKPWREDVKKEKWMRNYKIE